MAEVFMWHGEKARHPPFHFPLFIGVSEDFGFTSYISETYCLYIPYIWRSIYHNLCTLFDIMINRISETIGYKGFTASFKIAHSNVNLCFVSHFFTSINYFQIILAHFLNFVQFYPYYI